MIILYDNYVRDATITSVDENLDYDFSTALKDDRLSRVGRGYGESVTIVFDLFEAKAVNKILLCSYNLTDSCIITIEANTSDSWTTPAFSDVLTFNEDNNYGYLSLSENQSYRYWRILVNDPGNPDGYAEISALYIGQYLQMPDISTGTVIPYKTNSTAMKGTGGQLYSHRQLDYKAAKITMNDISNPERIEIKKFWKYVNITVPFWLIFWEESLDTEPPVYCSLTTELEWNKNAQDGNMWSLAIEIEECF